MTENLLKLGFTEKEAKVFLVLLRGDLMAASDIAKEANIRRTDVYDILNQFVKLGYINEIDTNRITMFQMIDPRIIGDKVQSDTLQKANLQAQNAKAVFDNLFPLYKSKLSTSQEFINIEVVRGHNRHRAVKFTEFTKQSQSEILLMVKLENEGTISDEADKIIGTFIKRGGIFKCIYQIPEFMKVVRNGKNETLPFKEALEIFKVFEKNGEQIRFSNSATYNFAIFDRYTVYMNIFEPALPKNKRSDIIIKNKDLATFLANTFESYWGNSKTINELI
jgi:sugar-specific transcriptional regulator TrmB